MILILFVVTFPLMVWGVMSQGWWFPTMAASFLSFAIIIMFLTATGKNGIGETGVVDAFVKGASSLVGVSLIIGLARGINLVLNNGKISDTMLQYSSTLVAHMSGPMFIIVMLLIFFCWASSYRHLQDWPFSQCRFWHRWRIRSTFHDMWW